MPINESVDTSSTEGLCREYDFIIVGGGTAGLVIAARLTENPSIKVLVLEAGANRTNDARILTPGLRGSLYDDPKYDWQFEIAPQKELDDRIIPCQRGKVLGGCSAINQLKIVYTSKSAFDAWESMGNPGWNWDNILPYLRRFHTHYAIDKDAQALANIAIESEPFESNEGPIQTSYSAIGELEKAWYASWKQIMTDLKYKGSNFGGFLAAASIDPKTRTRSYAATGYYSAEVASRPNLTVITEALVERICFVEGSEIIASGVQFISRTGNRFIVKATREVILSAGVIKSPQLLEISGIGSSEVLTSHGISVVVDNPNVGEHLQDHPLVLLSFEVVDGVQSFDQILRNPEILQPFLEMYAKDGSGPLGEYFSPTAYLPLLETLAPGGEDFLSSLLSCVSPDDLSPIEKRTESINIKMLSQPDISAGQFSLEKLQFNVKGNSKVSEIASPKSPGDYFTFVVSLSHPFSQGTVHINSTQPMDQPTIDPKYLSHPMDLEILSRLVQFIPTLTSMKPISTFLRPNGRRIPTNAFTAEEPVPTMEQAKKLVRETLFSNYHLAGTCRMADREHGGVVNSRLVVHGVKNLRVVDASIFPLMPMGNIVTSVYAIAERAADLIKEDWRKGKGKRF